MPYVKKNVRLVETGKMLTYQYPDDNDQLAEHKYPETVDQFDLVWETPWQPEHAPVGSVVRWKLNGLLRESEEHEVTVTGHYWNGVKSWVILTDTPCPILGGTHKTSFNGSLLTKIVSRGNGGVQFRNCQEYKRYSDNDHQMQSSWLPTGYKRPHEYASRSAQAIVLYVLGSHPAFADDMNGVHLNANAGTIVDKLRHLFTDHSTGLRWCPAVTANKKKLVKGLKRIMPHLRLSKEVEAKRQAEEAMSYSEMLMDFDNN